MEAVKTVPTFTIVMILITLLICVGVPIALTIIWNRKTHAKITSFFIGAGAFAVFALILESIVNNAVLIFAGEYMTSHIWPYALYGGFAAALFEEVGRYVAMRFVMKDSLDKPNGIMYGIGHGGVEAILTCGTAMVSNLAICMLINMGATASLFEGMDQQTIDATIAQLSPLWEGPSLLFLVGGFERLVAMALHIMLSYFVYLSIKKQKKVYFFLAFASHFVVDAGTVLVSSVAGTIVTELFPLAMDVILGFIFVKLYKADVNEEIAENTI